MDFHNVNDNMIVSLNLAHCSYNSEELIAYPGRAKNLQFSFVLVLGLSHNVIHITFAFENCRLHVFYFVGGSGLWGSGVWTCEGGEHISKSWWESATMKKSGELDLG